MPKVTGAVVKDFYFNHWPKGMWHEDSEVELEDENGKWILPDDAIVDTERLGYLGNAESMGAPVMSFTDAFKAFQKETDPDVVLVFKTDAERAAKLRAYAAEIGIQPTEPQGALNGG